MTKTPLFALIALSALMIGSISIGTIVFADNDFNDKYRDSSKETTIFSNSDSRMYVNSLAFEFNERNLHDSCDVISPPCILIDPLDMDNEIFIIDPELKNTRTLIQINVNEKDNFPTNINDIFDFPECYLITLANIDGQNGVLVECNSITNGIIDVTYSFSGPEQNFNNHNDENEKHHNNSYDDKSHYSSHDDD